MKVLLCGGGTGGSVTSLLAVAEEIRLQQPATYLYFIGSKTGPERQLVSQEQIPFFSIFSGKLRRYFDWRNMTDLIRIFQGFWQSVRILSKLRPDVVLSTGSFVAVPVIWAAWFMRIPSLTHQLDPEFGLANRLVFSAVTKCTVGFSETAESARSTKVIVTGNPYRPTILSGDRERGLRKFGLKNGLPTLLVTGGGTGAQELNRLILDSAKRLVEHCQIIHLTGVGKAGAPFDHPNYHSFDFLKDEMRDALWVADLVVSRAGLSTITELSILGKPTILIPLPDSHQENNATLAETKGGVIILKQNGLTADVLSERILDLISRPAERARLGQAIQALSDRTSNSKIVKEIFSAIRT